MTLLVSLIARRHLRAWIAAAVALSAAALMWLGYRAVTEWRHAATMLASRRAEAAAELLLTALTRDMRGAQMNVLASADLEGLTVSTPVDLLHPIAGALARYPYVEAFFSWSDRRTGDPSHFWVRADRRPAWLPPTETEAPYPVVEASSTVVADRLLDRITADSAQGRRYSVFDLVIDATTYQVVAVVSYDDALRERPAGVLAFLVNTRWARERYFPELATEVAAMDGAQGARFSIADSDGAAVAGPLPDARARVPFATREFPLTFFDPLLVSIDPPKDLAVVSWRAFAAAEGDQALAAAEAGARRTLILAGVMAVVLIVGLLLSVQAGLANANLANMRSDFVSAVTHELKAPIANLRAIHETLASGRSTLEMSRDYAQMGTREATRLGRLVENLLAYARITDVADAYSFSAVPLRAIVDRSVQEFSSHLDHGKFDLRVEIPDTLPAVRADALALGLLLNNLVDNAVRYSDKDRALTISAAVAGVGVELSVADRGIGIPDADRHRVTRKFFRGRHSHVGGSGLGLAIVDRIVRDHHGTLEIKSTVGAGTTVIVGLPIAS